jgi:hypothetical protein
MVAAIPLTAMAKVNRLLTVDTPYVDTDHLLKISLVSFRPLDTQLNLKLFNFLSVSADSSIPGWFFYVPNFGAKASIKLPIIPLTVGASVNYIAFTGKSKVLPLIANLFPGVTITDASLNFNAARWDVMAALDLKLIRIYGTMDFQVFGLESVAGTNTVSSYFHPTVGADIQLGNILAVFAEIGYYIPLKVNVPPLNQVGGALSLVNPSDFTAGLGVELDLAFLNLRLGVQYPGISVTLDPNNPKTTTYGLPVIPYANLSLQF